MQLRQDTDLANVNKPGVWFPKFYVMDFNGITLILIL